jgi:hypothetical protein
MKNSDWVDIPNYPNYKIRFHNYQPEVLSVKRNQLLKQSKDPCGYPKLLLSHQNKSKMFRIHKLIQLCFDLKGTGSYVKHINGVVDDNRFENLCNREVVSRPPKKTKRLKLPKGVFQWEGKFRAHIYIDGKRTYIAGSYDTPQEAHQAYKNKVESIEKA